MPNLVGLSLALIILVFVVLAHSAESSQDWRIKLVLYFMFAASAAGLLTFGAQTGVLFDGRARSDHWIKEMFLPTFAYTVWVAFIMQFFAVWIYRVTPSFLLFISAFTVILVVVALMSVMVLISLAGS